MAERQRKKQTSVTRIGSSPEMLSPEEIRRLRENAMNSMQLFQRAIEPPDELTMRVNNWKGPLNFVDINDIHSGALPVNTKAVKNVKEFVRTREGTVAVGLGDYGEGMTAHGVVPWTIWDVNTQIEDVKDTYSSIQNKVMGAVTNYKAHDGHVYDASGFNPAKEMFGKQVQIRQGGRLHIEWSDKARASLDLFHQKGGNTLVPTKALTNLATRMGSNKPNAILAAHNHRAGFEVIYSGKSPSEKPSIGVRGGTEKGSSREYPRDPYGERLGLDLADPSGQGVILNPRFKNGKETGEVDTYPYMTLDEGKVLHDGLIVLDRVERQRMRDELLGRIKNEVQGPEIKINYNRSDADGDNPEAQAGGKLQPLWQNIAYDVRGLKLPLAIYPLQNVLWSSTFSGEKQFSEFIDKNIRKDPYANALLLRAIVDKGLAGKPDKRDFELDRLVNLLSDVSGQLRVIMLDSHLRDPRWQKDYGDASLAIAAGSTLSKRLHTPLVGHLSTVEFNFPNGAKRDSITIAVCDGEGNYASNASPVHGLYQIYLNDLDNKPDAVVGGHMAKSGVGRIIDQNNKNMIDPVIIGSGHFARFSKPGGWANIKGGARPGQMLLIMPKDEGRRLIFPGASESESRDIKDALTLKLGLRLLGIEEPVLQTRSSRRR